MIKTGDGGSVVSERRCRNKTLNVEDDGEREREREIKGDSGSVKC